MRKTRIYLNFRVTYIGFCILFLGFIEYIFIRNLLSRPMNPASTLAAVISGIYLEAAFFQFIVRNRRGLSAGRRPELNTSRPIVLLFVVSYAIAEICLNFYSFAHHGERGVLEQLLAMLGISSIIWHQNSLKSV